ncbi:3-hydroxy-9,10-secoandrosta-1,3,5(10)-triene-9,17-dione monooxygenase [Spinactinospora alkalitolerans]|uniref:3-hydroxy-9,10-secoandrosta-1,3,5(10)-triene-9, 17-dione monooxygenase n=1 Tax=Spinactinospora alkalitolerans TaxID=687207 RepID=A0A852TWF9_9ACTN|nr:acyl-CoA dehydrogenase family protein [Spinactinospora alkalitolerans]NYE47182.1 3-hydroxy-9,10-secoandrosta-1,3,5(10)-triene-9,17-dione monooxygenase [Spinactinospora alkalitolerans]
MTIVGSVRAAAPVLAAEDAGGARQGRLTDTAWAALQETGILRALQPRRWGGGETSPAEFLDAVVEASRVAPAAGWVSAVVGVHPWQVALFGEETQKEIWGDTPDRALASSYTPTGKVTRVPGGYRVSGRWAFSSGCLHCDGVILGGVVGIRDWNGHEVGDFTSVILDRDQYTIDKTWNTAGLQGTGSNDIVVDGAFVPEHRGQSHIDYTYHLGVPLPGRELNTAPLYRLPWAVLFNSVIAAGALGAARGFADAWIEATRERKSPRGGSLCDDPLTQQYLADAVYVVDGGLLRLRRAAEELLEIAEAGEWPERELRAYHRHTMARSAQEAGAAVTRLLRVSSGRTAYLDHPLHQRYQDVMAAVGHAFLVADPLGQTYAAIHLGSQNHPMTHL